MRIDWANNTTWVIPPSAAPAPADVSGAYLIDGLWTQIRQSGRALTLVNERGEVSSARLSSDDTSITADGWPITGAIVGSQINWSNGTVWTRTTFDPPALSRFWTFGTEAQMPKLEPNDGELFLTNEFGLTSRAVFLSSTQILAVNWGVIGNLTSSNTRIEWNNNTLWTAAPSALDELFADEFNPFD
jgi:hypothetical protein